MYPGHCKILTYSLCIWDIQIQNSKFKIQNQLKQLKALIGSAARYYIPLKPNILWWVKLKPHTGFLKLKLTPTHSPLYLS
ncbi:hypothetical protein HanXRQr2_Chr07g0298511 [Helianthus annuus]|uniref:Uncharacterized protein n=1 Tax=Helianthus annuus TaxID=4232 RepID=A0A251UCI0_HELAN|nr:hypothetical protein HanXRQr2_Chr07g0298511 [Helianthus annuus]KAJ0557180.1 hypothetical protein HanIR_Chr07g0322211 [Helianthus annuus]KAJ0905008.1 hypothetical protein HanPSC8_Chr07g0288991 [Helianthus annuus]